MSHGNRYYEWSRRVIVWCLYIVDRCSQEVKARVARSCSSRHSISVRSSRQINRRSSEGMWNSTVILVYGDLLSLFVVSQELHSLMIENVCVSPRERLGINQTSSRGSGLHIFPSGDTLRSVARTIYFTLIHNHTAPEITKSISDRELSLGRNKSAYESPTGVEVIFCRRLREHTVITSRASVHTVCEQ